MPESPHDTPTIYYGGKVTKTKKANTNKSKYA